MEKELVFLSDFGEIWEVPEGATPSDDGTRIVGRVPPPCSEDGEDIYWRWNGEDTDKFGRLFAAAPALLDALREITAACEADCGRPGTEGFSDDESVGAQSDGPMALTFGMMRRARAALAAAEGEQA